MRRHTLIGERIVRAAPALVGVRASIRSSHERWDGNGYPDGSPALTSRSARRSSLVCDAYAAMTTERCTSPR